jgi:TetR/AcrR family transcriptional regulator, mexCD-oprJ operon repressor
MTTDTRTEDTLPRRADARRNIEAILSAAGRCLARDPDASMGDIAAEAHLGRVTVYGHFKSRRELVELAVRRTLDAANETLREVDLSGNPASALARLVAATWDVTARSGSLLVAAEKALPAVLLRELHQGELEDRVRGFIADGQDAGAFRTDLPTEWLVATFHAVVHTAANEVDLRRLDHDDAASVITATLLGVLSNPQATRRRRT